MTELFKNIGNAAQVSEKVLGQLYPATGSATSIYNPPANILTADINTIYVCNTSASATTFSIYLDDDGTSYTNNTALFYQVAISAKQTVQITGLFTMNSSAGNLAVQAGSGSTINFTVMGKEVTNPTQG